MAGQDIQCSVGSCKHNEGSRQCSLSNISVGNCAGANEVKTKKETECSSFSAN